MGKEPEQILNEFKERLSSFIGLKLGILRLTVCERAAKISATLSHSFLLLLLGLFAVFFIFMALGFWLSELTGRLSLGFLLVSIIAIIILFISYYMKKQIKLKIANIIVASVMDNEDEEEKDVEKEQKDEHKTTPHETPKTSSNAAGEAIH